jgi:hypothetical protein
MKPLRREATLHQEFTSHSWLVKLHLLEMYRHRRRPGLVALDHGVDQFATVRDASAAIFRLEDLAPGRKTALSGNKHHLI